MTSETNDISEEITEKKGEHKRDWDDEIRFLESELRIQGMRLADSFTSERGYGSLVCQHYYYVLPLKTHWWQIVNNIGVLKARAFLPELFEEKDADITYSLNFHHRVNKYHPLLVSVLNRYADHFSATVNSGLSTSSW